MTKEERTALQDYNRQFFVATTEHDVIQEYIRIPDKHDYNSNSTTIIYQWQAGQILQFLQDNLTNIKLNAISLGKSLKFLGFEKRSIRKKNGTVYVFELCINYEQAYIRASLKECFLKK
jgi:hypothetical protein